MKKNYCFGLLCATTGLLAPNNLFAQHNYYGSFVPPADPNPYRMILTINPQDGAYLKKDFGIAGRATQIDGERVLGTPFFLDAWVNGDLTTIDSRTYHFPFRYNAYKQVVNFVNGKDTFDVTDEIKEFSLYTQIGDTAIALKFENANQYKKQNKTFYYQVIIENDKGQLLKTNQKVIRSLTDGLLAAKGTKYFDVSSAYFYYDKASKRMVKINADGSSLKQVLHLDDSQLSDCRFSNEDEIIGFFTTYFQNKEAKSH